MTAGAVCMVAPACIGLATGPGVAIALFCVGGFAHQMLSGALLTLAADVFDTRAVGTASGMAGSAAWIGGMLFTFAIGQSADDWYGPLFAALVGLDLLAAVVLWALLRDDMRRMASSIERAGRGAAGVFACAIASLAFVSVASAGADATAARAPETAPQRAGERAPAVEP